MITVCIFIIFLYDDLYLQKYDNYKKNLPFFQQINFRNKKTNKPCEMINT